MQLMADGAVGKGGEPVTRDKSSRESAEKSDGRVVPEKSPNNETGAPGLAEAMEERRLTKGNPTKDVRVRTQRRGASDGALQRVRQAAKRDKEAKFTALLHHVYRIDHLRTAYRSLDRNAAPGVDGITWQMYGEDLEANLEALSARLKRGAYKGKPVARRYIPKNDGSKRPLGLPTLEDKLVQRATTEVLNAVYEEDFLGFSYGFRPGRSAHDALDAVSVGIERKRVNWVLDADIRGFFDAIDHEWMVKFIEHRIRDQRVIRLIQRWLKAGVLEDGIVHDAARGTPQGGSISPLLANVYLHYVLDLWVEQWRKRHAKGDVIFIRYADDFVLGFEHRMEAEWFLRDLAARLQEFALELHPDKTRLLEFGRFAAKNRRARGEGKPETFDFLGFTHFCGKTRKGRAVVRRKTKRKTMTAKLQALRRELMRRQHYPVPSVGRWLGKVLRGHYNYYGVPGNSRCLDVFRWALGRLWCQALRRRSQNHRMTWKRFEQIRDRWLPRPRITHPYPDQRLRV